MATPTAGDIAEAVGLAIPAFFGDAFDQFVQGEGGYIAAGEPKGAIAQIGQGVARAACRRYGAGQAGATGRQAARYERACRPYLDTLSPSDGLGLKPPFLGGQCATLYKFGGTGVANVLSCAGVLANTVNGQSTLGPSNVPGPIQSVSYSLINPTNCGFGAVAVTVVGAGGQVFGPTRITGPVVTGNAKIERGSVSAVITRVDGGLDNCGNTAPVAVPVPNIPDPTPPPFRFNPVPGIDVGVDVTVNPDGSITFDVGTGDVTVNPFPEDGAGESGDPSTDPGAPGASGDTGTGGSTSGDAPPGQELVGVLVDVLQAPTNPNVFANNSAQVFRGIGYVRMGYPSRLGTDISGGTVISPQFFHAQQRGLTSWATRANTGFNLRTTPYYRDI